MEWAVYIVRTARDNLYTGIAKDVEARVRKHNDGDGSKCLRGQSPVVLVWESPRMSKSEALQLEHRIKTIGKSNKEAIVEGRLKVYRTVNMGWSFALPVVLEIIDPLGVAQREKPDGH